MSLKLYLHNILHGASKGLRFDLATLRLLLRYYRPWKDGIGREAPSPLEDRRPWLTLAAIDFLESILHSGMTVFEYGSGGSSLFFLSRVSRLVSIEHDHEWYARMEATDERKDCAHWELCFIPPDPPGRTPGTQRDQPLDPSAPEDYSTHTRTYAGRTFRRYCGFIDTFTDESFDLILIDGRARPSCFLHALRKISPGGYIVWDDTFREHYRKAMELAPATFVFRDFPGPSPYAKYFGRTSTWQAPGDWNGANFAHGGMFGSRYG